MIVQFLLAASVSTPIWTCFQLNVGVVCKLKDAVQKNLQYTADLNFPSKAHKNWKLFAKFGLKALPQKLISFGFLINQKLHRNNGVNNWHIYITLSLLNSPTKLKNDSICKNFAPILKLSSNKKWVFHKIKMSFFVYQTKKIYIFFNVLLIIPSLKIVELCKRFILI